MSKKDVAVNNEANSTIGVRVPDRMRPTLRRIAQEMQISEGQLLYRAGEAICTMIESTDLRVPHIVASHRELRRKKLTALDEMPRIQISVEEQKEYQAKMQKALGSEILEKPPVELTDAQKKADMKKRMAKALRPQKPSSGQ